MSKFFYLILSFFFRRPLLASIAERYNVLRRPRIVPTPVVKNEQAGLYTSCSFDGITGEKLTCTLSVLPQVDQLPNMFTYVSLQRNFLVNLFTSSFSRERLFLFQCDTVTNLSDLLVDQDDEDVKNLLISIQSDSLAEQQQSKTIHFDI